MSKYYERKSDALEDLENLGSGEVIQVLNEFFRVTTAGLMKVNYQDVEPINNKFDRNWSNGRMNNHGCKSSTGE